MNTEEFLNITSSSIVLLIIEALALFIILKLIRKFLPLLPKKEKFRKLLRKHTQIFEIIAWVLFLIHVINKLNNKHLVTQIIIISLLAAAILYFLWFYFRDYINGLIFRTNYNIYLDDYITVNNVSGRVKSFKNKYIELESKNGDIFYVNYSNLMKGVISRRADTEQSSVFSFSIKIFSENYSVNKISEIKKYLLTFPSVSTNKAPVIKVANNTDKHIELNISFVSLDEERNDIVMEAVRDKFNEV
ncbi:MAG: mechanosensitive ion channel [Bacteroidales bacterium]|jgi:hypothetical protein|nr:mechanosensitive ion channel [Bacteroidales bacterium]